MLFPTTTKKPTSTQIRAEVATLPLTTLQQALLWLSLCVTPEFINTRDSINQYIETDIDVLIDAIKTALKTIYNIEVNTTTTDIKEVTGLLYLLTGSENDIITLVRKIKLSKKFEKQLLEDLFSTNITASNIHARIPIIFSDSNFRKYFKPDINLPITEVTNSNDIKTICINLLIANIEQQFTYIPTFKLVQSTVQGCDI